MTVLTGKGIEYFQLCARISAIELEGKGLKHSSGRSVLALCKRVYNLKGSRGSVLKKLNELKERMLKENV